MSAFLSALQPAIVWRHFATLCATPRASKQEAALIGQLADWARARGLGVRIDAAGNLLLRKPATAGREGAPGIILQAHLDMVFQSHVDMVHDSRARSGCGR